MKTIFSTGLGTERPALGQDWGSIFGTLLTTGTKATLDWYTAKRAADRAKQAAERAQEQLKQTEQAVQQAQTAQQQQQQIQQQQAIQQAGLPQNQIMGLQPSTFYIGAGLLGVGAIVTAILASRG